MKVDVLFFALARDQAGTGRLEVTLPEGATVATLREHLAAEIPAVAGTLSRSMIAVGDDYATDDQPLTDGAQVACIPPVSGG